MRHRWEPAFKWLGDMTTPVRDLDVYELDMPTMAGWLVSADAVDLEPLARHLRIRRTAERRVLVRGLRSARFRRLVTGWGKSSPGSWSRRTTRTENIFRQVGWPTTASLGCTGEWRMAVPRSGPTRRPRTCTGCGSAARSLRYALEVFAPVVDEGARKRTVGDLKGLQDVLGRFQDSEVQRGALRGFAEEMMADGTSAGAVLAMGELIGHLDAEQDRARREFDVAFARFTRPSSLQLMHRLGVRR